MIAIYAHSGPPGRRPRAETYARHSRKEAAGGRERESRSYAGARQSRVSGGAAAPRKWAGVFPVNYKRGEPRSELPLSNCGWQR